MARVLCAWELGSGLGHIGRIIPIARELRALGHEVVMVLRDSAYLHIPREEGFDTLAAPLLHEPPNPNPQPLSLSDILLNLGYDDVRGLHGALRGWQSMLRLVKPDVVMADYAPMALVAAGMARVPRVTVGSGFSLPPPGDPIPALRDATGTAPGVLRAIDDRLLMRLRAAVGGAAGVAASARAFFDAESHLLCTFAEIDPFGAREGVEYLGPPGNVNQGLEVAWQTEGKPRVLAYLKPGAPRVDAVVAGLQALDAEVVLAYPGEAPGRVQAMQRGAVRAFAKPIEVAPLMAGASLAVFHAGSGFAAQSLVAGVPMALLPTHLEQFLIAKRAVQAGVGEISAPDHAAPDFRQWFMHLMSSQALREAARREAAKHRGHSFSAAARAAAQRIAALA